jgi:hypothetical protein
LKTILPCCVEKSIGCTSAPTVATYFFSNSAEEEQEEERRIVKRVGSRGRTGARVSRRDAGTGFCGAPLRRTAGKVALDEGRLAHAAVADENELEGRHAGARAGGRRPGLLLRRATRRGRGRRGEGDGKRQESEQAATRTQGGIEWRAGRFPRARRRR